MARLLNTLPRPRAIRRTGDDTPAGSVWGYVWRMTGWHQLWIGALAVLVAALGFAPVEVQRRLIDDAIVPGNHTLLLQLGLAYGVLLLTAQAAKVGLAFAQGWLTESAARYTRAHLTRLRLENGSRRPDRSGEAVSIIGPEVDKLGGFAGEGPSGAVQNLALLTVGIVYMLHVDARVAAIGLALLLPQVVLAPILQRRLNRLIRLRVRLMRALGNRVAAKAGQGDASRSGKAVLARIYANRMGIHTWKAMTKAALNLMNGLAPLSVLLVGGWLAIAGETTVGIIVAFVSGFQRIEGPLRALIAFYRQCAQAEVQHDLIARWM